MNNRIIELFKNKQSEILSIFFTAGFPNLKDTKTILESLEKSGVDLVEIGMPYSDPVADGETIQVANKVALDNGMSLNLLFEQLAEIRKTVSMPLILMGYLNPVEQYGVERFCQKAVEVGIDGLILPDLPIDLYVEQYKVMFDSYNLSNVLLVTPQTAEARIRMIDDNTDGFIYMVSDNSITGKTADGVSDNRLAYFNRINEMKLKNPTVMGFGIHDKATFQMASQHSKGAIIGSAFIRMLEGSEDLEKDIEGFVGRIKG
ncbi:MAG: tryptophan synthase alpha chain [Cognaticolwellia sp.]|jgi:tryptophan synthase alpha chain